MDIQMLEEDCWISDCVNVAGIRGHVQGEGRFMGQLAGTMNNPATSQSRSIFPSMLLLDPANEGLSNPDPELLGQACSKLSSTRTLLLMPSLGISNC